MAGVNVDLQSLIKIRDQLGKLQNILNRGYSNSQSKLSEIEQKVDESIKAAKVKLGQMERRIEDRKRAAARMQEESDRIQKEIEDGKRPQQGLPYNGFILDEIEVLEKQKKQLQEELDVLIQKRKDFGNDKEWFLELFRKVASGTGGGDDNEHMQMELTKLISNLDDYVHTSFSSESATSYDQHNEQMRQQNAANAAFSREQRETAMANHQEYVRQNTEHGLGDD